MYSTTAGLIITFYLVVFQLRASCPHTSTLWRLSPDQSKIVEAPPLGPPRLYPDDDPVLRILSSTVSNGQENTWTKNDRELFCTTCSFVGSGLSYQTFLSNGSIHLHDELESQRDSTDDEVLDCGKPVNFTYYDGLVGVANRHRHPNAFEPHLILILGSKIKRTNIEQNVDALERRLRRIKREQPKSTELYNQIGNFWRLKGDSAKAIECFRRALAVAPHNSEVLLNLARILFTLQYLDDAIYLTKRSLETRTQDGDVWRQYFTLGEIFKAYGQYQEAAVHLQHTLELKPGFEPAQLALKEMEAIPSASLQFYTVFIIISLGATCLLVILITSEGKGEEIEKPGRNTMSSFRSFRSYRCRKLST